MGHVRCFSVWPRRGCCHPESPSGHRREAQLRAAEGPRDGGWGRADEPGRPSPPWGTPGYVRPCPQPGLGGVYVRRAPPVPGMGRQPLSPSPQTCVWLSCTCLPKSCLTSSALWRPPSASAGALLPVLHSSSLLSSCSAVMSPRGPCHIYLPLPTLVGGLSEKAKWGARISTPTGANKPPRPMSVMPHEEP